MIENEYENKFYCTLCKKDHRRNSKIGERHYLWMVENKEKKP